jgi:hypothetical protein
MKKLSLILMAMMIWMSSFAQVNHSDSTLQKIELNLDKMHKQYRTGTVFMGIGAMVVISGIAAISQDSETEPAILYMGGLVLSIGGIIHIDSHKFLNRKRR